MKRGETISTFNALFLIITVPVDPNSEVTLANPILFFKTGENVADKISPFDLIIEASIPLTISDM